MNNKLHTDAHLSAEQVRWRRFQSETMLGFSRIHQRILQRSAQLLQEEGITGITPSRANALIVLFNARRSIKARELARELAISEVTVSRFIRKMEEDGWVERTPDPADGRAMLIQPTAFAREMFARLVRVSNDVLDSVFRDFDESDMRTLNATVERIQSNLSDLEGI